MNYVGFIKEYDNIDEAIPYNSLFREKENNIDLTKNIIDYLNNGILFFGWMGYIKDLKDNELAVPQDYYTDGNWIWPAYFPFFLTKYTNVYIDPAFKNYLTSNKFIFKCILSEDDKYQLELDFIKKLN